MEHIQAMAGKLFKLSQQDHKAHIDAHLNFMGTRWSETILQLCL